MPNAIYDRIRQILESARTNAARSVNSIQVVANWLIGREIVEQEQGGKSKAAYGARLLEDLSLRLRREYGGGYSVDNLELFRRFYREYPALISETARRKSTGQPISDAARRKSNNDAELSEGLILYAPNKESWRPGGLHPDLSWTHYRALLRLEKMDARAFYEIETVKNNWPSREMERQIHSLLYERLALSKDKKGLLKLATKGHEIRRPGDVFKDPIVIEFLGLPESPKLVESNLEQALINNLQSFLLELGKGFAFMDRQHRITLDGDHFYIDLVFYHSVLKCYVLIDLKSGKLTHQDLGQMQLYVNYFDEVRRTANDNPTLGLILCADKNDAVVRFTLGRHARKNIFASRYKLHLPTEKELRVEIKRELLSLRTERGARRDGPSFRPKLYFCE